MKIDHVKLKEVFIKSKLTTADMAKAAGWVGSRRFTQLLSGKSTTINPRIGEAIAKKLKVKTSEIIQD